VYTEVLERFLCGLPRRDSLNWRVELADAMVWDRERMPVRKSLVLGLKALSTCGCLNGYPELLLTSEASKPAAMKSTPRWRTHFPTFKCGIIVECNGLVADTNS
jgi:hypothetical protein